MLKQVIDNWFTVVTGIAGLISLALQLAPLLPQYKNLLGKTFCLLSGVFVGSLLTPFVSSSRIEVSGSNLQTVLLIFIIILFVVGVYFMILLTKGNRISDLTVGVFVLMFMLLIAYGLTHIERPDNNQDLKVAEWRLIAEDAEEHKNYDRAIWAYQQMRFRIVDQGVRQRIEDKIAGLRKLEAGLSR